MREALAQLRTHDSTLRRVQRELEGRVPEAHLAEALALVSAGIHADPNVIKLLKSRQENEDEGEGKVRVSANSLARKLGQLSEALSMLLAGQKRLEGKLGAVEGELGRQLSDKVGALQLQLEELRGEASRSGM